MATFFTEAFFGIRGRLKTERVETFIKEFSQYIRSVNPDFDPEYVDSEDFGDFFEEVLIRVSKTNSKEKLGIIKRLLAQQTIKPESFDLANAYLDIASELNQNHIVLLKHWYVEEERHRNLMKQFRIERERLKACYDQGDGKISTNETYSEYQTRLLDYNKIDGENFREEIKVIRTQFMKSFENGEFDFWTQDLRRIGLLEHDTTSNRYTGEKAFTYLYLTPLGKSFMDFISK